MTELLATLPTAEQASRIIAADIKAYPQGGDKREEHLRLFGAVLSREVIKGAWAARYAELRKDAAAPQKFERREFSDRQIARWQAERASFFSSAAQPAAAPEPEDTPEPEAAQAEPKPRAALPAVIPPQPPPASWDDLLTVMNNQHAIIDNVGGKTVIASWTVIARSNTTDHCVSEQRQLCAPLFQPVCNDRDHHQARRNYASRRAVEPMVAHSLPHRPRSHRRGCQKAPDLKRQWVGIPAA